MQEESTYHKTFKAFEAAFNHHSDKNLTKDRKNLGTMLVEVPKEWTIYFQNTVAPSASIKACHPKYLRTCSQKSWWCWLEQINLRIANQSLPLLWTQYFSLFIHTDYTIWDPCIAFDLSSSKTLSQQLVNAPGSFTAKRNLQNNCLISPNSLHMISSWVACEAANCRETPEALMLKTWQIRWEGYTGQLKCVILHTNLDFWEGKKKKKHQDVQTSWWWTDSVPGIWCERTH